jgi:CBS domain-containing protein
MDWEHLRHVPVEDEDGNLVGLTTSRHLMRFMAKGTTKDSAAVAVQDIMLKEPISVSPNMGIIQAMHLMRQKRVACLPVTKDGKLVGLVTERDFLDVAGRLFEEQYKNTSGKTTES